MAAWTCRKSYRRLGLAEALRSSHTAGELRLPWGAARGGRPMDLKNKRLWWVVAAVIIVLIAIGYVTGWFGGAPAPEPQQ